MALPHDKLQTAYRHCEDLLRQQDPDRFFATLFAPAAKRPHLMALYAFSAEIAHIQESVREPLSGEIRMQWWRDALQGSQEKITGAEMAGEEAGAHPVAAALDDTIRAFGLPRSVFINLIDARVFDLYREPMPDMNQLEGYCGETCSVLFQMAAMILAGGRIDVAEAAGHGGVAYAVAGLIRAFPWQVRRGSLYIPLELLDKCGADAGKVVEGGDEEAVKRALVALRDMALNHLEIAEKALETVPAASRVAFLPLVLVRPYLRLMDHKGYKPFETVLDLAQWRKQWILWRAARKAG